MLVYLSLAASLVSGFLVSVSLVTSLVSVQNVINKGLANKGTNKIFVSANSVKYIFPR